MLVKPSIGRGQCRVGWLVAQRRQRGDGAMGLGKEKAPMAGSGAGRGRAGGLALGGQMR